MIGAIEKVLFDPYPLRSITQHIIKRFKIGAYEWRIGRGAVERPHYGYCVFQGALLAKKLGYKKISVIEFGVAGGKGLLNLEYHADQVTKSLGIEIDVYGFDTGEGLPEPVDYRDLPYHWKSGFFRMDLDELRRRLRFAKLILGDIRQTSKDFCRKYEPAPIAAVIHDFDFYSSTASALRLFDVAEKYVLPRVFCYFDDIVGTEVELYNDYTGERLAISEFNGAHDQMKLSPAYHLLCQKAIEPWYHQIFILHRYNHARYNDFVSDEFQERPVE
jgi:hypothetical protein